MVIFILKKEEKKKKKKDTSLFMVEWAIENQWVRVAPWENKKIAIFKYFFASMGLKLAVYVRNTISYFVPAINLMKFWYLEHFWQHF